MSIKELIELFLELYHDKDRDFGDYLRVASKLLAYFTDYFDADEPDVIGAKHGVAPDEKAVEFLELYAAEDGKGKAAGEDPEIKGAIPAFLIKFLLQQLLESLLNLESPKKEE